eukprot:5716492-Heterocapsa_arctica.AAC.1
MLEVVRLALARQDQRDEGKLLDAIAQDVLLIQQGLVVSEDHVPVPFVLQLEEEPRRESLGSDLV